MAGANGPSSLSRPRRSPPRAKRIAMNSTPAASPASKTGMTWGWSVIAVACDSRRKRARNWRSLANVGARTFSATVRPSRSSCARKTVAIAVRLISASIRYPAMTVPGRSPRPAGWPALTAPPRAGRPQAIAGRFVEPGANGRPAGVGAQEGGGQSGFKRFGPTLSQQTMSDRALQLSGGMSDDHRPAGTRHADRLHERQARQPGCRADYGKHSRADPRRPRPGRLDRRLWQ